MSEAEQPTMHAVTGGRYEATCGKCLRMSVPVHAVDGEVHEQAPDSASPRRKARQHR